MNIRKFHLYILIIVIAIFTIIYVGIKNLNNIYNKVVFIDDKNEVLKKFVSTVPLKIEIFVDYLPKYTITDPKLIFDIWEKIGKLPTFNYVKGQDSKSSKIKIKGYIYFLDQKRVDFDVDEDLRIGNLLYGFENDETIINIRKTFKSFLFSKENIAKSLMQPGVKLSFVNEENGKSKQLSIKTVKNIAEIIKNSEEVSSVEEIGRVLSESGTKNYIIKVKIGKANFLTMELLKENYYSLYYENQYLYLLKGNLKEFLSSIF